MDPFETSASNLDEEEVSVLTALECELACLWRRLGALILDALIHIAVIAAVMVPLVHFGFMGLDNMMKVSGVFDDLIPPLLLVLFFGAAIILAFLGLNWHLLAMKGQTLGKRIMGIHIVDYETQEIPSFSNVFFSRYLLGLMLLGMPIVGLLVVIIDALFVFGQERRCLHDLMAGTMVIQNPTWQEPPIVIKPPEWE